MNNEFYGKRIRNIRKHQTLDLIDETDLRKIISQSNKTFKFEIGEKEVK